MIRPEQRKRVGSLIRTLLNINISNQAKLMNVSVNSIYGFEACKFNSVLMQEWYDNYYNKLGLEKILTNVGLVKAFSRWEELVDNLANKEEK